MSRGSDRDRNSDRRRTNQERQPVRREGSRHGFRRDDYGTWNGDVDDIPGRITGEDKPDMRDSLNREKFLGETPDDRRDRNERNLGREPSRSRDSGRGNTTSRSNNNRSSDDRRASTRDSGNSRANNSDYDDFMDDAEEIADFDGKSPEDMDDAAIDMVIDSSTRMIRKSSDILRAAIEERRTRDMGSSPDDNYEEEADDRRSAAQNQGNRSRGRR